MHKVLDEFIWAQKYRPQKIEDIILPEQIKKSIQKNISEGGCSNFLFDGPAGVGKTTIAYAIANELNAEVLFLNGSSSGRGIDTIRNEIPQFCASMSMDARFKIVLIDEADHLTNDAQAALRGTIEKFSKGCAFIFTTNLKNRLSVPIRSRFVEVDFHISKEEENDLKKQMMKRLINVLKAEEVEVAKEQMKVVAHVIENFFPNNRKILNQLQVMVKDNGLDASSLSLVSEDVFIELFEHLKAKKWNSMRSWVAEHQDVNPEQVLEYFWKNAEATFGIKNMPVIIMALDDYQRNISISRNTVICTVAVFTKIMQSLSAEG